MCYYINGKNYVAHTRDDLIDQINAMRARFKTYSEFAETSFEQSFLPEELAEATVVKSQQFQSSYLENLGNGSFRLVPLPLEAQFAPLYGMMVDDVNSDGFLDVLAVGNFYSSEVSIGRYDALTGLVLLGDGTGSFHAMNPLQSGFKVEGDAKSLTFLPLAQGQSLWLIGNNDKQMQAFGSDQASEFVQVGPLQSHAVVLLKNNSSYRVEFPLGSSYLSSSARVIKWTEEIKEVDLYHYDGSHKKLTNP